MSNHDDKKRVSLQVQWKIEDDLKFGLRSMHECGTIIRGLEQCFAQEMRKAKQQYEQGIRAYHRACTAFAEELGSEELERVLGEVGANAPQRN